MVNHMFCKTREGVRPHVFSPWHLDGPAGQERLNPKIRGILTDAIL